MNRNQKHILKHTMISNLKKKGSTANTLGKEGQFGASFGDKELTNLEKKLFRTLPYTATTYH